MQVSRLRLIKEIFDELIKIRKLDNLDYDWLQKPEIVENIFIKDMKRETMERPQYYDLRKNDDIIYAIDDDDNQTNDFENETQEQEYKKFLN